MSDIKLVILGITGGIHTVASVEDEPEIILSHWSIRECDRRDGRRTRHLVGYNMAGQEGRVSSAIEEFDPDRLHVRTGSGRVYELVGKSGTHVDSDYVWEQFLYLQHAKNAAD
ncbi:MAG: hypothetical protein H7Z73_03450, partial [Candidatus Saccharibacteria bacterium]|nr:hypothetical protein [Moraxellaceae bacterium]